MHTRNRRPFSILRMILVVILAACGTDDSTTSPAPSDVPSVALTAAGGTQTDTEWGRIWDNVPTGFPRFPGARFADPVSADPVSATYAVDNEDTAQIAGWMQSALETASFGTESMSGPLESGGFVIESVGQGACRIQTSVEPMGGLTFLIVRYGAACPAG